MFVDARGYEGFYQISDDGKVLNQAGLILKPCIDKDGYERVSLSKYGEKRNHFIHRLVAINYIDNPKCYKQIDHINRDKLNNTISNLRWISQSGNMRNRQIKKKSNLPIGVYTRSIGKWCAQITSNHKKLYLGQYNCPFQAGDAYKKMYDFLMSEFD